MKPVTIDIFKALQRHNIPNGEAIAAIAALLTCLIESERDRKQRELFRILCQQILVEKPDMEFLKQIGYYE